MVRRCAFCDSPVPADATVCPVCKEEIAEERLERLLPLLRRPESPEIRMMSPVERLWGVIRRPAPTYRDIAQRPDTAGPMLIIIFNALIVAAYYLAISSKFTVPVMVNNTLVETSVLSTDTGNVFYGTALSVIVSNLLLGIIYLFLGSAFAHLAFKITGGTGNRRKTMAIVGYSMMPVVIFRLFGLLLVLLNPATVSMANPATWEALVMDIYNSTLWTTLDYMTTASFVWVGFLLIFGIREAHDTSTELAFLVSLACMLVLGWTFWQAH